MGGRRRSMAAPRWEFVAAMWLALVGAGCGEPSAVARPADWAESEHPVLAPADALAPDGDAASFFKLLHATDSRVRLAGLIALDEAFHEGRVVAAARHVLLREVAARDRDAGPPLIELLEIARRWPFPELAQPVAERLQRDPSPSEFAAGLAMLRRLGSQRTLAELDDAMQRLLDRVVRGQIRAASRREKLDLLDVIAARGPSAASRTLLDRAMRDPDAVVRMRGHYVLVAIGDGDAACIDLCRRMIKDKRLPVDERIEGVASLAQIESRLDAPLWRSLLKDESPRLPLAALRSLGQHRDRAAVAHLLAENAKEAGSSGLAARGPRFACELAFLGAGGLGADAAAGAESARGPLSDEAKRQLRSRLLTNYRSADPQLGRLAFRIHACGRCHLAAGGEMLLGPSLEGIADLHSAEYLVDSVLFPSQVIKTGFRAETIITDEGKVWTGKVVQQGDALVITPSEGDPVRISVDAVEARKQTNLSLMPASLETTMSEAELTDLIAYLATLHAREAPAAGEERGKSTGGAWRRGPKRRGLESG